MSALFSIEKQALAASMDAAARMVRAKNDIPILANALIRPAGDHLLFACTDLDILIRVRARAADIAPGEGFTVPAHLLRDIARKLPDGCEARISDKGNGTIGLQAGRSKFTLPVLPAVDFPDFDARDLPHGFSMPCATLKAMLDAVAFAICTDETRFYLNGIYLAALEEDLIAVATDGHRLGKAAIALPDNAGTIPGVILPRGAAEMLIKALPERGDVEIALSDSRARFSFGDMVFVTKLVDGTFPDFQRVIPQPSDNCWSFDVAAMAKAVDRVSTITGERGRAATLEWDGATCTIQVTDRDTGGQAIEDVAVEPGSGAKPLTIGFNVRYFGEICARLADRATLSMRSPGDPGLFIPAGDAEISTLYVLMPMRV